MEQRIAITDSCKENNNNVTVQLDYDCQLGFDMNINFPAHTFLLLLVFFFYFFIINFSLV